jgi:TolA-binding protein
MIMAFTTAEFEDLAMKNTRIIMKILTVFSNQLRRIHRQVSILTDTDEREPEAGLFYVGEYYLKNRRYSLARTAFNRYLTYYPSGKNASQAAKNLEIAGNAANLEMKKKDRSPRAEGEAFDAAKVYYQGVSLVSRQKFQPALQAFRSILEAGKDNEYMAKSSFEIGRCLFFLRKYEDCLKQYAGMITKYPRHPQLGETLFFMGQSHEKCGHGDQAATFYKKVITMIEDEDNAIRSRAVQALKALEG